MGIWPQITSYSTNIFKDYISFLKAIFYLIGPAFIKCNNFICERIANSCKIVFKKKIKNKHKKDKKQQTTKTNKQTKQNTKNKPKKVKIGEGEVNPEKQETLSTFNSG